MERLVLAAALALGLGGCGATAVVGAAATVVATGVKVAGSAVSATVDVVGSGVSGAIDMATRDDDEDRAEKPEKPDMSGDAGKANHAATRVLVETVSEPPEAGAEPPADAAPVDPPDTVEAMYEAGD